MSDPGHLNLDAKRDSDDNPANRKIGFTHQTCLPAQHAQIRKTGGNYGTHGPENCAFRFYKIPSLACSFFTQSMDVSTASTAG